VRGPVDRRGSTFEELVDEAFAELEEVFELPLLELDETRMLEFLAEGQRRIGRSLRSDAFAAACWRYWVEHSRHAREEGAR
jgi:hypothetical protein